MKSSIYSLVCLLACIVLATPVSAQDSYPLVGDWIGYWGPSPDHLNRILVNIDWDGKEITGTLNPGSDDLAFKNASMDPTDWSVHFEVDAEDFRGNAITYVIEGKIENLGSPHRSIVGTWQHGDVSGDFNITLQ